MRSSPRILVLLGVLLCSACAAPKPVEKERLRFFWPPDPEYAKIEYIDTYYSSDDIGEAKDTLMDEFLGTTKYPALFQYPYAAATGPGGVVVVTDSKSKRVALLNFVTGKVSSLAGGSEGVFKFRLPLGVDVGFDGKIYIADSLIGEILVFSKQGIFESSFGGDDLERPVSVAVNHVTGQAVVVDAAQHKIVVFDKDRRKQYSFGERGKRPGSFNYPMAVDIGPVGEILVLDTLNARVQVFSAAGHFLREFGERGTASGSFSLPKGLSVNKYGQVYVTDSLSHKVVVFELEGNFLMSFGGRSPVAQTGLTPGGFYAPIGIATDETGGVFVVDTYNRLLHKFQYMTPEYLEENPILPGQTYFPYLSEQGKE